MRLFALMTAAAFAAELPDPKELVRKSAMRDAAEMAERKNYTFVRKTRQTEFSGTDTKSVERKTYEVTMLYGRPYSRLIEKDGKPLGQSEAAEEQKKLDREMAKRAKETEADRKDREAAEQKEIEEEKKFRDEIAEAFHFRILGEETIGGAKTWLIQCDPRPEFQPRSRRGAVLAKAKGKLWITKDDLRWVRVEAEILETYSLGWFVLRVSPGTRFSFEAKRAGDIWVPAKTYMRGQARVAALKKFDLEIETLYEDYRRFQAESRVVGMAP